MRIDLRTLSSVWSAGVRTFPEDVLIDWISDIIELCEEPLEQSVRVILVRQLLHEVLHL